MESHWSMPLDPVLVPRCRVDEAVFSGGSQPEVQRIVPSAIQPCAAAAQVTDEDFDLSSFQVTDDSVFPEGDEVALFGCYDPM